MHYNYGWVYRYTQTNKPTHSQNIFCLFQPIMLHRTLTYMKQRRSVSNSERYVNVIKQNLQVPSSPLLPGIPISVGYRVINTMYLKILTLKDLGGGWRVRVFFFIWDYFVSLSLLCCLITTLKLCFNRKSFDVNSMLKTVTEQEKQKYSSKAEKYVPDYLIVIMITQYFTCLLLNKFLQLF